MTSDVTLTSTANQAQRTNAQSSQLAQDFSQFLQLLTTQLQNQDPLNPMDSTEFTNQLVQFSQVEQSINTNQKLDNLVNMQLTSLPSIALGYVGLDINYQSAEMNFDGSAPINVAYTLSQEAASAKINIFNEKGNLVYTTPADKESGTLHKFVWDGSKTGGGTAEAGTYSIQIAATDSEGNPVTPTTAVSGRVRGVETQDGTINLLVGDRAIPLTNIINATVPSTTDETTGGQGA